MEEKTYRELCKTVGRARAIIERDVREKSGSNEEIAADAEGFINDFKFFHFGVLTGIALAHRRYDDEYDLDFTDDEVVADYEVFAYGKALSLMLVESLERVVESVGDSDD